MFNIQIVDPTLYPGWDDLILRHPESTFFHTSAWARVLAESYGYTPLYFTVFENGGISGLIPVMEVKSALTGTRGVSLPFTDYCDPIVNDNASFKGLFDRVVDFGRRQNWRYIELRGNCRQTEDGRRKESTQGSQTATLPSHVSRLASCGSSSSHVSRLAQNAPQPSSFASDVSPLTSHVSRLTPCGSLTPNALRLTPEASFLTPYVSYRVHILDLSENEEEMFYGFKDSARRNIKKANREGVEARIFNTLDSVKEFYRLNSLTRREHGLPPQPYGFFRHLHQHAISKGLGFVALASHQGKSIAGAVFLHSGQKALFKYGASDRKDQNLRGNNLVMWEAVKWYSQNGYRSLHFGRTEPENEGLLQFKAGWGATEHPLSYYRYDLRKNAFVSGSSKISGLHNMIFRRMPLPLLNTAGKWLYRHAG